MDGHTGPVKVARTEEGVEGHVHMHLLCSHRCSLSSTFLVWLGPPSPFPHTKGSVTPPSPEARLRQRARVAQLGGAGSESQLCHLQPLCNLSVPICKVGTGQCLMQEAGMSAQ